MSQHIERAAPIPPRLCASVQRHEANLARLIANLRQAGMDEHSIEASVGSIVESYRIELMDVVKCLATAPEAPASEGPP